MASLNKVMLIGNLGKDPEVRYTQDGKAVASFSIATTDKWKDKTTGENREKTEWHRIVAFGRLGEICGEYLSKGKQIFVEGRLRTRSYEKDGITRYTTEIEASDMRMLGAKDAAGAHANQGRVGQPSQAPSSGGGYPDSFPDDGFSGGPPTSLPDDDIPF